MMSLCRCLPQHLPLHHDLLRQRPCPYRAGLHCVVRRGWKRTPPLPLMDPSPQVTTGQALLQPLHPPPPSRH